MAIISIVVMVDFCLYRYFCLPGRVLFMFSVDVIMVTVVCMAVLNIAVDIVTVVCKAVLDVLVVFGGFFVVFVPAEVVVDAVVGVCVAGVVGVCVAGVAVFEVVVVIDAIAILPNSTLNVIFIFLLKHLGSL